MMYIDTLETDLVQAKMKSMVLTQVYLDPRQKAALQRRARSRGTKMAEEVRNAVDAYLGGPGADEIMLLDAATLEARRHLDAMIADLDRMNANLDRTLHALDHLRAGAHGTETEVRD